MAFDNTFITKVGELANYAFICINSSTTSPPLLSDENKSKKTSKSKD